MTRTAYPRRQSQRGYALLLVFAMAAGIAVALYLEMPRVAFEHQRDKEALLVERGEQYTRAIQLYVRKFNKYPQTIDELEQSNNIRFLRRRYTDPITGKDEWRLIHIDGAGQYLDSMVHKRPDQQQQKSGPSLLASNIQGIGESATVIQQPGQGGPAALQRRASDRIIPGMPGGGMAPGVPGQEQPSDQDPNQPQPQAQPQFPPGQMPGNTRMYVQPGAPDYAQGMMPQPQPGTQMAIPGAPPQQPGYPTNPAYGGQMQPGMTGIPGMMRPGSPYPTQPVSSQIGGQIGVPVPQPGQQQGSGFGFGGGFGTAAQQQQQQGFAGSGQQGFVGGTVGGGPMGGVIGPTGAQNPTGGRFGQSSFGASNFGGAGTAGSAGIGVASMGGSGGFSGSAGFGQGGGNQAVDAIRQMLTNPRQGGAPAGVGNPLGGSVAGGIAGVASKADLEGILVYNEKTNYKEWEFLYDLKKEMQSRGGGQAGMMGAQGQNQPGMPGMGGMPGMLQGQQGPQGQQGQSGFGGFGPGGSSGFTSGFGSSGSSSGSSGSGFGFGFGSGSSSSSGSSFGFGSSSSSGSSSGSSSPRPAPGGPGRR